MKYAEQILNNESAQCMLCAEAPCTAACPEGFDPARFVCKEKSVIMCAMKKNISPKAEEIVKEEDPLAFMIVTSATEIFGEGYKSYFSEKL